MLPGRPPLALTVARVQAIEITLEWRWAPVLVLATWLLAQNVLPARFPTWELRTSWLTAAAAVLAGEAALLLHELTHALLARSRGLRVRRIIFHGFQAQTVVDDDDVTAPSQEMLIALAGPATNLALAGLAQAARVALVSQGPLDAFLLMLSHWQRRRGGVEPAARRSLGWGAGAQRGAAGGTLRTRGCPVSARTRTTRIKRPSGDQP